MVSIGRCYFTNNINLIIFRKISLLFLPRKRSSVIWDLLKVLQKERIQSMNDISFRNPLSFHHW